MKVDKFDPRIPSLARLIKCMEHQSGPTAIRKATSRLRESKDGAVHVDGFRYQWHDTLCIWEATCEVH